MLFSQCTGTYFHPTSNINVDATGGTTSISTDNYSGDYSIITGIIAGENYEIMASNGYHITVREGSNTGTILGTGISAVTVTALSNSNIYVSWYADAACNSGFDFISTSIQCTTCGSGGSGGPIANEYINFFPWVSGNTNESNWQSDPDISQSGTKTGCVFADIQITNSGAWYNSYDPSWASVSGLFGLELHTNWSNTNQQIVMTVTFKNGGGSIVETPCEFDIHDLNAASCSLSDPNKRFIDEVNIIGYKSNLSTTVSPVYSSVCSGNVVSGNTVRGTDDCGSNQQGAHVAFTSDIARFVLTYSSGTGSPGSKSCPSPWNLNSGNNPKDQHIQLSPLTLQFDCANPLPVEYISFDVQELKYANDILWSTSSELNSDYFEIERMNHDNLWETIGRVESFGTQDQSQHYSYLDARPQTGISYYRLKQFDFDGKFEYSPIVSSHRVSEKNIFPNPTNGTVYISEIEQGEQITILDKNGKVVFSDFYNGKSLNVDTLVNGVYFVKINGRDTEKLVIIK